MEFTDPIYPFSLTSAQWIQCWPRHPSNSDVAGAMCHLSDFLHVMRVQPRHLLFGSHLSPTLSHPLSATTLSTHFHPANHPINQITTTMAPKTRNNTTTTTTTTTSASAPVSQG